MSIQTLKTARSLRSDEFGSVGGSPGLPSGFADIFESRLVDIGGLSLHIVTGGKGPPLLLLGGWPQNWYTWRYLMAPLAKRFTVIAADPRGVGLSDKPEHGYDSATQAADLHSLMSRLGHERFAMICHDVGGWTGYAMVADERNRIDRIVIGEAGIPGLLPSSPIVVASRRISDLLWHFNFNRVRGVNEALVKGREEIYFGHQLRSKAASPDSIPEEARNYYVDLLKRDDGSLAASFEFYRALDEIIPQNAERMKTPLDLPILTFAGELFAGDYVEREMRSVASNVRSVIVPGCGHFVQEEAPDQLLAAVLPFLQPYADTEQQR
jgi:pimeloyl-ACP methyl ester carboxylesterase